MKNIKIALIFLFFSLSQLGAQVYFNLGIEEGTFLTEGNLYFINNVSSDIAYIYPLNNKFSLIGYYQLKYAGPGIGNSAETKFSERSQDHFFMLKSVYKLNSNITLKPGLNFFKEFYKFGKNESWGQGLYDYNKYEVSGDAVFTHFGFPLTVSGKYQVVKYPNYSDLLTLLQTEFTVNEPQEDYKNIYGSVSVNQMKLMSSMLFFMEYSINYSVYDNKKVLQATGYTGNADQKITYHSFNALPQYKLDQWLFSMNVIFELNDSNQNYIAQDTTGIKGIRLVENYYSFSGINIKPYVTYFFTQDQSLTVLCSYFNKKYSSRLAQDSNGVLLNSKVGIQALSAGIVYSVKLSKYFSFSPAYMYAQSTSNNKYQRSVSYNYTAHLITLKMNYEY